MTATSAKARYSQLTSDRSAVLEKAREASDLTIPGLIPRDGDSDATLLDQAYQSLGARGANNLTSKLMLALFPPGSPFFRYFISDDALEGQPPQLVEGVRSGLAKIEIKAALRAETMRSPIWQYLLHLVVGGNAIFYLPMKEDPQVYGIHQFVVRRTPSGRPAEAIIKEAVFPHTLAPEVLAKAGIDQAKVRRDQTMDLYTVVKWQDKKVTWWQELNDKRVSDESVTPEDISPWIVARWKARPGRSYGDSHVMENLGDLMSFEGLSKAVFEFGEIAAKVIFLDKPSSQTDIRDLQKAKSGDFVQGSKDDIDVLQLDKYADFQVVDAVMQRLERRIAEAFLLSTGTIRNAERVTAEEIRQVAQELEDALGGVYTVMASEFQLPFTRRLLYLMQREGEIKPLPKDTVKPLVVTGFDALGRAHSNNRIRAFIADARNLLGDEVLKRVNQSALLNRLGTGWGVEDLEELLLSEDEVAAADQQAMMAQAMQQAAPGVAQEVTKSALQEEQ
jgi:hypothetical protein